MRNANEENELNIFNDKIVNDYNIILENIAIKKEAELNKLLLESYKAALAKSEADNIKLKNRIDAAYKIIKEIAIKSSQESYQVESENK